MAVWAYLVAFLLVAVGAGFAVRWINEPTDDCAEIVEITVDAAPSIAPAVTEYIERELLVSATDARCVQPVIRTRASADVADRRTFAPGNVDRPDLWIPESTVWLGRAREYTTAVPEEGISIATSPVVLAATEPAARAAGWPSSHPAWPKLLESTGAGIPDPATNASAALALLGIERLDLKEMARAAVIQRLTKRAFAGTEDPFQHLPAGGAEPEASVFPSSEQAVIRHDADFRPGMERSVVAGYPDGATPWLDYPAVVIDGIEEIKDNAARALQQALREPAAVKTLAKHGFRDPSGKLTGGARDDRVRAEVGPRVRPPTTQTFNQLLQGWATFSSASRMVVALDVSGSMNKPVPGTQFTRMQAAVKTLADAMKLLRANTQLTLWEFSTERDGKLPYRVVAPWRPMIQHISARLPDKLGQLISKPDGFTGLYDTTLAAYEQTQANWDPALLNLVLILTDGKNDFSAGISRTELLDKLRELGDPERPTRVIFVGLGTEVDPKELREIAEVTGGQVHLSPDVKGASELLFTILREMSKPG